MPTSSLMKSATCSAGMITIIAGTYGLRRPSARPLRSTAFSPCHGSGTTPPYGNWRSYSPSLFDYADNIRKGRKDYLEILHIGLPAYYQKHAAHLSGNPTDRKKNGAMALAILTLLERNPGHWDAIRWLNSSPSPQGETFLHYLTKWHRAVPPQHTKFVATIASLFGLSLPELPEPGKPIRQ